MSLRSARRECGVALIEMLVLGFAVLLVVVPSLVVVGRIVDATAEASSLARDAATWTARHGAPYPGAMGGVVVDVGPQVVRATAHVRVVLVDIAGASIGRDIVVTYDAPVSPYRSRL